MTDVKAILAPLVGAVPALAPLVDVLVTMSQRLDLLEKGGTVATAAADPLAALQGLGAPATGPTVHVPDNLTGDMITALITPHVGNEAIKAALGVEMRAMGISALPETQPAQYAELYRRFATVLAANGVGGVGGGTTAAASSSII